MATKNGIDLKSTLGKIRLMSASQREKWIQTAAADQGLREELFESAGVLIGIAADEMLSRSPSTSVDLSRVPSASDIIGRLLTAIGTIDEIRSQGPEESTLLAKVGGDLDLEDPEDFYFFIEFNTIGTDVTDDDLKGLVENFEPVRRGGYFLHSPLVEREYREVGSGQLVIGWNSVSPRYDKFRLYLFPGRGLISMQSWRQLTDHAKSLRYLVPKGQRWISPARLTEFTLETCRFAIQKVLRLEASVLGVQWKTGFIQREDRRLDVRLPIARLPQLSRLAREARQAVPLPVLNSGWLQCRRLTAEGNAFDILRVVYEEGKIDPQMIPFCDGDQVSREKLGALGSKGR